jgi:hypothetical protein
MRRCQDAAERRPRARCKPAQRAEREPVSPEVDRLHAALRRSPIALAVQRLIPLTKGSKLKRFEVLLRSSSSSAPNEAPQAMLKAAVEHGLGSMIDRRVVTELIGWLVHHPNVWQDNGSMFSVNLTKTALHDEHFMKFVGLCLEKSSLPQGTIGFEVDVATAVKCSDRIAGVAAGLQRLGCPLVLDDFSMRTECFSAAAFAGREIHQDGPVDHGEHAHRQDLASGDHRARANGARARSAHGREAHRIGSRAGMADRARRGFHPIERAVAADHDRVAGEATQPPPSALTK